MTCTLLPQGIQSSGTFQNSSSAGALPALGPLGCVTSLECTFNSPALCFPPLSTPGQLIISLWRGGTGTSNLGALRTCCVVQAGRKKWVSSRPSPSKFPLSYLESSHCSDCPETGWIATRDPVLDLFRSPNSASGFWVDSLQKGSPGANSSLSSCGILSSL